MAKNTVVIKGFVNVRDEAIANAAITPGHLIERMSTGKVRVHATAGGMAQKLFALEDHFQGNEIDDAYSADDMCFFWAPTPGDRVYAIFDPTSGGSVAIGDKLESAGDGTLKVAAPASAGAEEFPESIVGVAVEAQATPGGRVIVEII